MQEMLANMNVEPHPGSPPQCVDNLVDLSSNNETEADEATAIAETSIPANTAHTPTDPNENSATTTSATGEEGNEVGLTGNASSRPG